MLTQLCLDLDDARPAPPWPQVLKELEVSFRPSSSGSTNRLERPEDVVMHLRPFVDYRRDQEKFWAIPMDSRCRPRGVYLVTLGTLTSTLASPREAFRVAVATAAARLVVAHNHPSGDPTPSSADAALTRRLRDAGEALDIPLQDHIILGDAHCDPLGLGHYSFRRAGLL